MHLIIFLLVYPIIWSISILPFPIFYLFSDIMFFWVYYVFGYRKKMVYNNIKLAFPEKSDKEIKSIRRKFYRHLCDVFLEMTKTISVSQDEMLKRFHFTNPEFLQELEKKKSIAVMMPHYGNWEWTVVLPAHSKIAESYGIYKRIRNKYFDNMVKKTRAKYNGSLIDTKESINVILKNKVEKRTAIYGFAADQSPKLQKAFHWQNFMGHEVPAYTGAEMLAKRCDLAVCYLKVTKVKRGYYEATFLPITENAKDYENYEITNIFLKMVEDQIKERPELYLWTHNRWKHRGKKPVV